MSENENEPLQGMTYAELLVSNRRITKRDFNLFLAQLPAKGRALGEENDCDVTWLWQGEFTDLPFSVDGPYPGQIWVKFIRA